MGAEAAYLAAGLHGRHHLRPGHTGSAKKFHLVIVDQAHDRSRGIIFQIAVNNCVFLTAFQHGRKRQHRKWQPAVAGFSGLGVEEDNHLTTLAA
jgi:hypothetical protein